MDLKITQAEKNRDKYIMTLSGEIDAYTAPKLKEELLTLTEKSDAIIIMDLSRTEYMDSTGLGVIIAGLKSAKKNNSTLNINGMTPRVERLFKITGLMDILEKDETVKEEKR